MFGCMRRGTTTQAKSTMLKGIGQPKMNTAHKAQNWGINVKVNEGPEAHFGPWSL